MSVALYRAALCWWPDSTPVATLQVLEAQNAALSHMGAATYEAVILAYEAGQVRCAGMRDTRVLLALTTPTHLAQEASFVAVTHWFATHGDSHGVSDAEVRLCVAVTLPAVGKRVDSQNSGGAEDDDPLDKSALAWCIDHGFEHVPASPPEADGEPAGVARVREALHAHTWPGLVAKPRGGSGSSSRAVNTPAGVEAAAAGEEDGIADKGSHERFEVLMAHMQRARDAAATVPDDVRRATAAELAMRMAQLLGVEDEGESDGDSDELDGEDHGSDGYQPLFE